MSKIIINDSTLELTIGDITLQDTDAIVNAANTTLLGGGGVDGAIHRVGGPKILEECKKIGGCPTGEARVTAGGNLKARYVIHTVGPVYRGGEKNEQVLLENAYRNSLKAASDHAVKSVSFPSISTGAYGYPIDKASKIALKTVIGYLKNHTGIRLVRFVLFNNDAYKAYEKAMNECISDQ
ncbi:O-acetyl-ADP-ribose deacetylase [Candidatus Kuenenia sp.]|uniref:O-acetyl-ADP-ribose deacetylase n=1 Tax=Candidatus Kuenenia sp. TaxID=2499824 RepID=UPI0032208381